jgi:hypothetical protein
MSKRVDGVDKKTDEKFGESDLSFCRRYREEIT